MKFLQIVFVIFLIASCTHLEEDPVLFYPNVDKELWSYFSSFEQEAKIRGIQADLKLAEITGVITSIADDGVAGTCQFGSHIAHVTVDQDFWNSASPLFREYVVYHELGHCFLNRNHNDGQDSQGNCVSIMQSGLSGCLISYRLQNRAHFIDELFGAN